MSFNSIVKEDWESKDDLELQRIENIKRMNRQIKEDAKELGICEKVLHCIRHWL